MPKKHMSKRHLTKESKTKRDKTKTKSKLRKRISRTKSKKRIRNSRKNKKTKRTSKTKLIIKYQKGSAYNLVSDDIYDISVIPEKFQNSKFIEELDKLFKLHIARSLITKFNIFDIPDGYISLKIVDKPLSNTNVAILKSNNWDKLTEMETRFIDGIRPYIVKNNGKWLLIKLLSVLLGGGHNINIFKAQIHQIIGVYGDVDIDGLPKLGHVDNTTLFNKKVVPFNLSSEAFNWKLCKSSDKFKVEEGIEGSDRRLQCLNKDNKGGTIKLQKLIFLEDGEFDVVLRMHDYNDISDGPQVYLETMKLLGENNLAPISYYRGENPLYNGVYHNPYIGEPYKYFYVLSEYLEGWNPVCDYIIEPDLYQNQFMKRILKFLIDIENKGYSSSNLLVADVMSNPDKTLFKALDYRLFAKHELDTKGKKGIFNHYSRIFSSIEHSFANYNSAKPFAEYMIRLLAWDARKAYGNDEYSLLRYMGLNLHHYSNDIACKELLEVFNELNIARDIHLYTLDRGEQKIEKIVKLNTCYDTSYNLAAISRSQITPCFYNFNKIENIDELLYSTLKVPYVIMETKDTDGVDKIHFLDYRSVESKTSYMVYHNTDGIKPSGEIVHSGGRLNVVEQPVINTIKEPVKQVPNLPRNLEAKIKEFINKSKKSDFKMESISPSSLNVSATRENPLLNKISKDNLNKLVSDLLKEGKVKDNESQLSDDNMQIID